MVANTQKNRREIGADHRRSAQPVQPPPVSSRRVAAGRLAIIVTSLGWIAYLGTWLADNFFNGQPINTRAKFEAVVYLLIITLLTASSLAFLISRLGYCYRALAHHRTPRLTVDESFDRSMPTLTVLVPSYREDAAVIRNTLLSAALQEYPYKRIVLLIDDPPRPTTRSQKEMLDAARALPRQIEELLAEPSALFAAALERFELAQSDAAEPDIKSMSHLAHYYRVAARWVERLADNQEIVDHADAFFAAEVLRRLGDDFSTTAEALDVALEEGVVLPRERMIHLYRRLSWTFRVQVTSFERKRYASLSHEPNKAMNLNSYLGLMGGSYREMDGAEGRVLVAAAPGASDLNVADPDYVLTLDADSVLLPEYCLRLVHFLEQSEHSDVAVAQTPYSAFPGSGTRLERIAGATTDLQYLAHQGLTYYDATSWVGANAVIRKRALDSIVKVSYQGDHEIRSYIQDRTVIEDTDSTIDLALNGWRLLNIPERMSYSATPPDFGALCVQRRRWSNGGLLIAPKLLRLWRTRRRRGERTRMGEIFLRWNYMVSIAWASLGLLILLAFPFNGTLISPLLALISLPYFLAVASDLKYCGYRRLDALRIYGFNLMLIPVNLAGTGESLVQAITATKSTFGRTPKVHTRTVPPFFFIVAPYLLVGLALYTFQHSLRHQLWENMAFAAFNVLLGGYAILAYIGLKNSIVDTWLYLRSLLYKPVKPKRRRRWRRRAQIVEPRPLDWRAILQVGAYDPHHWPTSPPASISHAALREVTGASPAEITAAPKHANGNAPEPLGRLDFRTVFQPIFDLAQERIVGYEALTRFSDGTAPERRLAEAMSAGVGADFELALTEAAISASRALPTHTWLAVNASSRTLISMPRFRTLVQNVPCPIVIELKEPGSAAADAALRQVLDNLPPNSLLAIENLGLDHASLAIVASLRPSFIKLDRGVATHLADDPARQAQITTMVSLAETVSCSVIAAGIESEDDLAALRELGVRFGQGYLLGRPNRLIQTP